MKETKWKDLTEREKFIAYNSIKAMYKHLNQYDDNAETIPYKKIIIDVLKGLHNLILIPAEDVVMKEEK